MKPRISDADFIRLFEEYGASKLAQLTGQGERRIYRRRAAIEKSIGRQLTSPTPHTTRTRFNVEHPVRLHLQIKNGVILIGGDCHYWPGEPSLMHRGFAIFCKQLKPSVVILNGDVVDLGQVSRHPPIGWDHTPDVADEIEVAKDRLSQIEKLAFKARKIWTLGNHDDRFETRLATVAPQYSRIYGVHLRDHFPNWEPCRSVFINENTVVKHRFKGGTHATHNNTLWAGRTVITGHLHSQKVTPLTDYNGDRWGVDTGSISDPVHAAFDYNEDNPKNWREGFCILTYKDGRLLPPELISKWDENHIVFRGEIIKV